MKEVSEGRGQRLWGLSLALATLAGVLLLIPASSAGFSFTCAAAIDGIATCSGPVNQNLDPCPPPSSTQQSFVDVFIPANALKGASGPTDDAPATVACGGGLSGTKQTSQDSAEPQKDETLPPGTRIYRVIYGFDNKGSDPGEETPPVAFTATVKLPQRLTASPKPLAFGQQQSASGPAGTTTLTLTITNQSSDTTVSISGVHVQGTNSDDFLASGGTGATLKPGQSTPITVAFTPPTTGSFTADVLLTGGDGSSLDVPLSGTGILPGGGGCTTDCNPSSCTGAGCGTCTTGCNPGSCTGGSCQECTTPMSCGTCTGVACTTSSGCFANPLAVALDALQADLGVTHGLKIAIGRITQELAGARHSLSRAQRKMLKNQRLVLRRELVRMQAKVAAIPGLGTARTARGVSLAHISGTDLPSGTVVNAFAEAAKGAVKSKLEADKAAGKLSEKDYTSKLAQANKLIDQLGTLGKLADGQQLSDAEQQQIVEDAVVGLVGEFAGKDAEELAGKMKTLIHALSGKLTDKEKKKILDKEIPNLVEKLVKAAGGEKALGKSVKELTEQIQTLVKLTTGKPLSDEEKAAIFNQAVLGLLEKTVFNGYLNPLFLKAAVAGYDFAKPFGEAIARGLRTAASRQIFTSATIAINAKDPTYVETIKADHNTVIQTTIQSGSYVGWIVTAYWDSTAMQVVLKVLPGEDKQVLAGARAFIRAVVGSKEIEWIFDPETCEETSKGAVLSAAPR